MIISLRSVGSSNLDGANSSCIQVNFSYCFCSTTVIMASEQQLTSATQGISCHAWNADRSSEFNFLIFPLFMVVNII